MAPADVCPTPAVARIERSEVVAIFEMQVVAPGAGEGHEVRAATQAKKRSIIIFETLLINRCPNRATVPPT